MQFKLVNTFHNTEMNVRAKSKEELIIRFETSRRWRKNVHDRMCGANGCCCGVFKIVE